MIISFFLLIVLKCNFSFTFFSIFFFSFFISVQQCFPKRLYYSFHIIITVTISYNKHICCCMVTFKKSHQLFSLYRCVFLNNARSLVHLILTFFYLLNCLIVYVCVVYSRNAYKIHLYILFLNFRLCGHTHLVFIVNAVKKLNESFFLIW